MVQMNYKVQWKVGEIKETIALGHFCKTLHR